MDPILICTSFKKNRFYLFSKRHPEETDDKTTITRDILNEKPSKEDIHTTVTKEKS